MPFFFSPDVDITIEPLEPWIDDSGAKFKPRSSGNVESSGRVGKHAQNDPERVDKRSDGFTLSEAAREFAILSGSS